MNLFIENLISSQRIQLTTDGSDTTINGNLAGLYSGLNTRGFRWSPDSSHIAYVQFDTKEVKDFFLLNNTDSLYSKIIPFQHVKPGEVLPACRAGFVSASGGETIWIDTQGDPRNHYITQLSWTPDSKNVVIQQLNRRQNTINVMFVERNTGLVQTVLTDRDETWLEPYDLHWINGGSEFTWISERDGWRHVYLASSEGGALKLLTDGSFDVLNIQAIDEKRGWLYYIASPENPTQRYLYRVGLDGSSTPVRVTPQDLEGTHEYLMPLDSQWAFHTYSTFDTPPVVQLIKLPSHEIVRTLVDNAQLLEKLKPLKRQPTEFFRVDIGEGVELDGWCMKPADFDSEKQYPVLFHVYGMPANQTVRDQWNGLRYVWHLMLTQLGYIIMSLDNRGTPAPRGRAWRKIIYRKHGRKLTR